MMLSFSKQYTAGVGQLVFVTSEPVNRVMSVVGLTGVFTTASSLQEVLASRGLEVAPATASPVQGATIWQEKDGSDTRE